MREEARHGEDEGEESDGGAEDHEGPEGGDRSVDAGAVDYGTGATASEVDGTLRAVLRLELTPPSWTCLRCTIQVPSFIIHGWL
jgi:hypothetical protein